MKIKLLKSHIPELFLIASVIYYWVLTSNLLNPYAIGLLAILIYQLISKKSTLGIIISGIVICLTLFMVLALISELSEFDAATENFNNLLIFGSLYLGLTLIMAGLMLHKYLKLKIN
jgi:threonine/homoserine/homoserine lactone efflux protein